MTGRMTGEPRWTSSRSDMSAMVDIFSEWCTIHSEEHGQTSLTCLVKVDILPLSHSSRPHSHSHAVSLLLLSLAIGNSVRTL